MAHSSPVLIRTSVFVCQWFRVLVLITVIFMNTSDITFCLSWRSQSPLQVLFIMHFAIRPFNNPFYSTFLSFHPSYKYHSLSPLKKEKIILHHWTTGEEEMTEEAGKIAQSKGFESGRPNIWSWRHLVDLERVMPTLSICLSAIWK